MNHNHLVVIGVTNRGEIEIFEKCLENLQRFTSYLYLSLLSFIGITRCPHALEIWFFFSCAEIWNFFPVPTILCRCVSLQTYLIAKCIGGFFHIYLLVDVIITIPCIFLSYFLFNISCCYLNLSGNHIYFDSNTLKVTSNLNIRINPLRANSTKWSNTLKQFVGNLPTNCLRFECVLIILWDWPLKG